MGKLHKIRKAIEANPRSFTRGIMTPWEASGARVLSNGKAYASSGSHRRYVRKVLRELGYKMGIGLYR